MADILIKSFNRPYYLDRCLASIQMMISGDYHVKVLDDGTPQKYLDKIQQKYPEVKIITSENFRKKNKSIEENLATGKEINGFEIPTQLWISEAQKASDYFIITEDDVWFTKKINLDELIETCKRMDINLLKLGWLGNKKDDEQLEIKEVSDTIVSSQPKSLFLGNKKVMTAFFKNQYKFFTILYKLGKVDHYTQQKYWALNSILMGLYNKKYWLNIWEDMSGRVDEKQQLANAAAFYRHHKSNKNFISRLKNEAMRTTFQSSATNSYHKYGNSFDVNQFNHQINEAWLEGKFDALQNLPNDFAIPYLQQFLNEKIDVSEFKNWVEKFKEQYRNIGCDVENG